MLYEVITVDLPVKLLICPLGILSDFYCWWIKLLGGDGTIQHIIFMVSFDDPPIIFV